MDGIGIKKTLRIFWSFFAIGLFTIGGGLAMLPLMEREFVTRKKWVTPEEIIDIFAVVQSVPGVIAINSSIFIGYRLGGFPIACVAALGVILPSFIVILIVAAVLGGFQDNIYVQKAFAGIRAAVTALILYAVIRIGKSVIKKPWMAVAAAVSFLAIIIFDVHAAYLILTAALIAVFVNALRKPGSK